MSPRSFISVTVLVLLFCFSARSQEPGVGRALDETETAVIRKKALKLLESVASQLGSLHSPENRARIGSNVADLLWHHDEQRSRSLFAQVQEDIRAGLNGTDPADSARTNTPEVFVRLRSDTVSRIATHDPDFALEFLRATRPQSDQLLRGLRNTERNLELRLAGQIAARNPQLALKLGRESLAKGFSDELWRVLSQLHRKDKEAALNFYQAIVAKLKSANLTRDPQATWLALKLARSFQPPEADEQVYRELIGILVESALAGGCANPTSEYGYYFLCQEIGSIFPQIERFYAPRAAGLRRWALDRQNGEGRRNGVFQQVFETIEEGTIEEILALASKYPEMQHQIYWSAMSKAEYAGDSVRARRIASDVPDEGQRRSMLAHLDGNQKWSSMNEEKLAELQQQLRNLRGPQERIQFLLSVTTLISANDRKTALALLDQAGQLLTSIKPGIDQLAGQMRLALMYCSWKSDRGFAIMESLIPKLNELVAAAATLDGFENNYFRDGEWTMSAAGRIGELLTGLAQNAGYFGWRDFDRSVTLAGQFERPELRLMAELKIAQGILTNQRNPLIRAVIR